MDEIPQERFQILALDGGGLKGIFTAAYLAQFEAATRRPVIESFDLVAGTSTGGIIALALGLRRSAEEILAFYCEHGDAIFPAERLELIGEARQAVRSRYDPDALESRLSSFFGVAKLGDSQTRLLIPAYHADRGDIYIFKTAHHPRLRVDFRERMADVARATGAAPTYLPPKALDDGLRLIDGGVWANNPVLLAVTEAMGYLERSKQQIAALRIGTTWEPRTSTDYPTDPGGVGLRKVPFFADIMMRGQMLSASGATLHLLGQERFLDVSPVVPPDRYRLDRLSKDLIGLAKAEFRKSISDLGDRGFLDHHAAPFQPVYSNKDSNRGSRKTEAA